MCRRGGGINDFTISCGVHGAVLFGLTAPPDYPPGAGLFLVVSGRAVYRPRSEGCLPAGLSAGQPGEFVVELTI